MRARCLEALRLVQRSSDNSSLETPSCRATKSTHRAGFEHDGDDESGVDGEAFQQSEVGGSEGPVIDEFLENPVLFHALQAIAFKQ
jgi:hypothetical protein